MNFSLADYTPDIRTQTSFLVRLDAPRTNTWIGLNPYLRPLPIPTWRTLVFPAGSYEVAWNTVQTCWRYLNEPREWPFKGDWMPSGVPLMPRDQQAGSIAAARAEYAELYTLRERRLNDLLLSKMNRMAGF